MAALQEGVAQGVWTLRIEDHATQDGGTLHSWALAIQTRSAQPRTPSEFTIELRFDGGLTPNQRSVFQLAAARWQEVIVGNLPSVRVHGRLVDDVLIVAEGKHIDGPSGVLGQAGPTHTRPGSNLPARGIMEFDSADLARMEQDGSLVDVIIHEMGHVLGIGTLWEDMKLLVGVETQDPEFNGPAAMAEYGQLRNSGVQEKVPVANTGGAGTRGGHWREATFGNELMTGFLTEPALHRFGAGPGVRGELRCRGCLFSAFAGEPGGVAKNRPSRMPNHRTQAHRAPGECRIRRVSQRLPNRWRLGGSAIWGRVGRRDRGLPFLRGPFHGDLVFI